MASTTMQDLLAQAEAAGVATFTPTAGKYDLKVTNANGSKTKNGDPKFGVQFEITSGPDNGKRFWTNFNLIAVKNDGSSNAAGLAYTFRDLAALGADASTVAAWDPDSANISEQVSAALVGTEVHAEVTVKTSNGYTNVNLRNIRAQGPGVSSSAPGPVPSAPAATPDRPF